MDIFHFHRSLLKLAKGNRPEKSLNNTTFLNITQFTQKFILFCNAKTSCSNQIVSYIYTGLTQWELRHHLTPGLTISTATVSPQENW